MTFLNGTKDVTLSDVQPLPWVCRYFIMYHNIVSCIVSVVVGKYQIGKI